MRHRYFLDDPFKGLVKHSILIEDDKDEDEPKRTLTAVDKVKDEEPDLDRRFHSSIIYLTLALTFLGIVLGCLYCKATCRTMCPS
jgi:hypothetical protein